MTDDSFQAKQRLAGIFTRAAATYDQNGQRMFSDLGLRLVDWVGVERGSRVLDVATGRGAVLFPAAERVGPTGSVVGIDLAEGMIAALRADVEARNLSNVSLHMMDAEHLEFPDNTFDRAFCSLALFFFPALDAALTDIHRVLKPGGWFGASTFAAENEHLEWLDRHLQAFMPPRPAHTPEAVESNAVRPPSVDNPDGLTRILAHAGFADIRIAPIELDIIYRDDESWWQFLWSVGFRGALERMDAATQAAFKQACLDDMGRFRRTDGIHTPWHILLAAGRK